MKVEAGQINRRTLIAGGGCAVAGSAMGRIKLSSKKKGFCLVPRKTPAWEKKLDVLNAKWFYTWGAKKPENGPPSAEFVPMQWGKWGCSAEKMAEIKKAGHKTLLGFNEPDQEKQANMSVEKAIELWPRLMDTGLRLGSPAGVHADGDWMKAFMEEVEKRGYRVDFITAHSYMGASSRHFLNKMDKIHKLYRKPVWITEFAVGDWEAGPDKRNRHSPKEVLKFMEKALPGLEKRDFIERYAWYSANPENHALGTSSLFNHEGTVNELGKHYASL